MLRERFFAEDPAQKERVPVYDDQGMAHHSADQEHVMTTRFARPLTMHGGLALAAAAVICALSAAGPARAQFAPPQVMAPPQPPQSLDTRATQLKPLPLTVPTIPSAPAPAQAQRPAPAAAQATPGSR